MADGVSFQTTNRRQITAEAKGKGDVRLAGWVHEWWGIIILIVFAFRRSGLGGKFTSVWKERENGLPV